MQEPGEAVHIAGVLVRVAPGARGVRDQLAQQAGVETHIADPVSGQLVVTIDAPTLEAVRAIHEAIGRVPGVVSAHLVCHIADPGAVGPARAGGAS